MVMGVAIVLVTGLALLAWLLQDLAPEPPRQLR